MKKLISFAAWMFVFWSSSLASSSDESVEVRIQRLSAGQFLASWAFSRPVTGFRLYPPRLGFRSRSWRILSGGFGLTETAEGDDISRDGESFTGFSVEFRLDSDFDPKSYVPVMPFSGGGAAVYSGFFSGDVLIDGQWQTIPTGFELIGLPGEATLLPSWASENNPVYVYFGQSRPQEAEQVVMIIDTEMPEWLRNTFRNSVPAATGVFSQRLQLDLPEKPLVLISAGELADYDGYSVKGGGLDGQFTIMLRGRDLLNHSADQQQMFEKMVAHELLHVWQQAMPGGAFNPEQPWLHEGSADALAVAALLEAGVWSESQVEAFSLQQAGNCAASLGDSSLDEAADAGNWTAIYSCGYLEFTQGVNDPFALWLELTRAAEAAGKTYSQEMLESLRD